MRFLYKLKCVLLLLLFNFVMLPLNAQQNFEFTYTSSCETGAAEFVEGYSGNFIGYLNFNRRNEQQHLIWDGSALLGFSKFGDTLTIPLNLGDTNVLISNIYKTVDSSFLFVGFFNLNDTDQVDSTFLFLMKMDKSLNLIWQKTHYLGLYSMGIFLKTYELDDDLLILGRISYFPSSIGYPLMIKVDHQGELKQIYIHFDSGSSSNFEFLLTPDSTKIWLTTCKSLEPDAEANLFVFDTDFNYLSSALHEPSQLSQPQLYHLDQSRVLLSRVCNNDNPPHDNQMCVDTYDTAFNLLRQFSFGIDNSDDYPAFGKAIDFNHPDSIYYFVHLGNAFGPPWPGYTNQSVIGLTDSTFQNRHEVYLDEDAYYVPYSIIATKDGGCFLFSRKYNHSTNLDDLHFQKLSKQDILTGIDKPNAPKPKGKLWPNPARDYIYFESATDKETFRIYNTDGRIMLEQQATKGLNKLDVSCLKPGFYVLRPEQQAKPEMFFKFIKH